MTQTKAKTKRRSAPKPRRGRELPDDACPTCGTIMRSARSKVFVSVNGDQMAVPDIPHLRCPKCGEGLFTLRSEEHTSELQSHVNLVCRLLLEKKKRNILCSSANMRRNKQMILSLLMN